MPTSYKDQFYFIDPANPPARGTSVLLDRLSMTDQNDDGDLDQFDGDSVNGLDITASWPGDTVTIRPDGGGPRITYTGTTFYLSDGSAVFTPTDGQVLVEGTFWRANFVTGQGPLDVADLGPTCFTPGTPIAVPGGTVPVERLRAGDLVLTVDGGPRPLRWTGRETFRAAGPAAPVRIAPGALGNDRALVVSQQHRVLVSGWRAELVCGVPEVLVPAVHLVDGDGIRLMPGGTVEYLHLLFDRHELVWSAGIATESFLPAFARGRGIDPGRSPDGGLCRPVARRPEALALALAA